MPKIGFAQYEVEFGEYDSNTATIMRLAESAKGADLLVFPELGLTGYEFKDAREAERYAEPFGAGPTSETLKKLAKRLKMTLVDRKSTRLNSSHIQKSRMPSSA